MGGGVGGGCCDTRSVFHLCLPEGHSWQSQPSPGASCSAPPAPWHSSHTRPTHSADPASAPATLHSVRNTSSWGGFYSLQSTIHMLVASCNVIGSNLATGPLSHVLFSLSFISSCLSTMFCQIKLKNRWMGQICTVDLHPPSYNAM